MANDDLNLDDILAGAKEETGTAKEDKPPKSEKRTASSRTAPWARKLETQLADIYRSVGTGFALAGQEFDSAIIALHTESLASSWVDLAERDSNVRATLERLMSGSAWGGVIMVHSMVILPIMANHGLIPGPLGQKLAAMNQFIFPAQTAANGNSS